MDLHGNVHCQSEGVLRSNYGHSMVDRRHHLSTLAVEGLMVTFKSRQNNEFDAIRREVFEVRLNESTVFLR